MFFLMFSFTLHIPVELFFASRAFALEKEFINLVSIVVDEDTYDEVQSKLVRYSRDVQSVIENTRVVILPTPEDASVIDIASLNESLYLEGYNSLKDVDYESRLIGTVFVGKIPLPSVFDEGKSSKTMLPYIDFVDKAYIYNHESGKYEKNDDAWTRLEPEIWHGVISPNTWDEGEDIQAIKDFFDKNHDFYTGQWVFDQEKWIVDGKDTPAWEDYEPYVFYYDQFRENEALQYQNYIWYQSYLENIEDITYNRYSKELAEKVSQKIMWVQNADISDLLAKVDPDFDISGAQSIPDANSSSDVLTRYITDNSTKKLLEIFNGSTLWEMRKQVYNAGRYNDGWGRVNMDMPPFLVSVLDQVSSEVIKNVNTSLENEIKKVVMNGLARDIAIPIEIVTPANVWPTWLPLVQWDTPDCWSVDTWFIYGTPTKDITNASQCSIYRWNANWWTLIEANRGYNVFNVQWDTEICGLWMDYDENAGRITNGLEWYWWGNSPVNLSSSWSSYQDYNLWERDELGAIRPLFDILWAKQVETREGIPTQIFDALWFEQNSSNARSPNPVDCFTNPRLIRTYEAELYTVWWWEGEQSQTCGTRYRLPVNPWDPLEYYTNSFAFWWPRDTPRGTTHRSRFCGLDGWYAFEFTTPDDTFEGLYESFSAADTGFCLAQELKLWWETVARKYEWRNCSVSLDEADAPACCPPKPPLEYNNITSHILHTSPTDEEFWAQVNAKFTPSLPIDSDRYIDFIWAAGWPAPWYGYQRIDFPQLFRVALNDADDLTLDAAKQKVKEHLDEVSTQMNSVIVASDPSSLTGEELELYDILKTGEYPEANVDLYAFLQNKPLEVFTLQNESKEISYFDTLVFSVYWNNLDNIASKYKFIFQEYLSNQFTGNDYNFHLPKSKKSYEIAYYAAPGDAQNMYVKLDPDLKWIHPYADIISNYLALNTTIMGSNVWDEWLEEWVFECAPPDGVNIFQWIPAVICWLKEMLPPTIKITDWNCGESLLSEDEQAEIDACNIDENKNGVNDCLEDKLTGWELRLASDGGKYYYFTTGTIFSETYTNEWEIAKFDNNSYVQYKISRVVVPDNSELAFGPWNQRVVYDESVPALSSQQAYSEAEKYISFNTAQIRSRWWKTKTYFYAKWQDADITFTARMQVKDADGNITIDLEADNLEIWVRGDRLFVWGYRVEQDARYTIDNTITASGEQNICAIDSNSVSLWEAVLQADSLSQAKEKLLLMIQNFSAAGNKLNLNYPLSIEMTRSGERVFFEEWITQGNLQSVYGLLNISTSGRYEVHVRDSDDFYSYRIFDVLPDSASNIEVVLGTNIVETWGNISTHLVNILDPYGNAANGEIYTVSASLSGNGLEFSDNSEKSIEYQVIEWYKALRLTSTDSEDTNTLAIEVKNLEGTIIERESVVIRTIEKIVPEITLVWDTPKVWGGEYTYNIRFNDQGGNLLTWLNSRVYLTLPSIYGRVISPYTLVENGVSEISFISSTLAAENIDIEFQLEWWVDIYQQIITILPEIPIKLDMNLSRDKIEASREDSSILQAVLKDRYNNDVFTDNTTNINLEIHPESRDIISANSSSLTATRWKVQFELQATDIPWLGYFSLSTDPDLSENSFELIGQAPFDKNTLNIATFTNAQGDLTATGKRFFTEFSDTKFLSRFYSKQILESSEQFNELPLVLKDDVLDFWDVTNKLVVNWYGKNAGSLETFFFWDKQDIDGNSYNSIYSVMLWAPYWDFTQQDYLAWSAVFDGDNAALAVTSLLNTPYKQNNVLHIERTWLFTPLRWWDITQDIEIKPSSDSSGRLLLDIHNNALETYVWRAYYNISNSAQIDVSLQDDSYSANEVSNWISLQNKNGQSVLEISEDGRFIRKQWSYFELDLDNQSPWLHLRLMSGQTLVAMITVSSDLDINITRDQALLETKLASLDDTIIVHLQSNQYSTKQTQVWDEQALSVYYQDPFANSYTLDEFHISDISSLESVAREEWIGWQDSNTAILSFAAWANVWEASQNYHSFSLVHIWDPVASLKPIIKKFNNSEQEKYFDATLWTIIESDEGLIWFQTLDYNNDINEDIITIHRDGYVSLYENDDIHGDYIYQRDLVFAEDGGSVRHIETGDFTGDGYEDIFFVTQAWQPALFNNHSKDFSRYDIRNSLFLSWAIIQAESFDMDSDGKDDIVTLDDSWQIHIFYGWWVAQRPVFEKKFIWDGYAIELSQLSTSHGWWVYFDWLVQLSDERAAQILANAQQYLAELEAANTNGEDEPTPEFIDESLVEQFLYLSLPYTPKWFLENRTDAEIISDNIAWQSWNDETATDQTQESIDDFLAGYDNYISYTWFESPTDTVTYFLRWQYADEQGIEITKTFTDTTPEFLQTWDKVYYDISITNTSSQRRENVAYVDMIPKYFRFATNTFTVLTQDNLELTRNRGINNYSILLDWFFLEPWEEVIVRYELETLPLSYWFMQVGLYEKWEVWDDIYGDIILKDDEKNCGREADIYRSLAPRSYQSGTTFPECRESDIELWPDAPNVEDLDGDGIPDYITELLNASESRDSDWEIPAEDLARIRDYGDEVMRELWLDSDGDGIPDSDDSMDNTDSATDFMWALDSINEAIDDISEDIDEIIEWLSCWFGGGSCFANPLNWAPLAPWNDPTLFWYPIWDGLRVSEWMPIFSALTWRQASCWTSPCCLPSVYPATSATFVPGPFCWGPWAWWSLGVNSATNFVRVFATPTLTGGFWIAVCFGWPAIVAGNWNPRWVHPIVPGGNCIVAAMPLMSCEWGEWDPGILWYPYPGNGFGLIHANCDGATDERVATPLEIESSFVRDYLQYLQTGVKPAGLYDGYKESFSQVEDLWAGNFTLPTDPLINIWWETGAMGWSVSIDPSAIFTWQWDVIDIQNKRVSAFPGFMMDWVERQLDEITSKLTNLPKIFVILPDFWGIFDFSFENFWDGISEAFEQWKNDSSTERSSKQSNIDSLRAQKTWLDCSGSDTLRCKSIDLQVISAQGKQYANSWKETLSWIREVYEFIGNIPLLNVESEKIPINVPWMEQAELSRFILDWKLTAEQWKTELASKSTSWSLWATCSWTAAEIARCQQENDIKQRANLEAWEFIASLERNIQVLEEYKEFPDKLAKLMNIKEVWLEQILCNIEAISKLMWEWINKNGERFKAWVELYLLIKAILKSWQLFIDVFAWYEAECHECKNERQDLQTFIWKLISVAIPSLPIIEFPKWSDIILDLHNVRAGLTVYMPDFEINMRPIVLPTLPNLQLPDVPSANFSLPALPTLPSFELPELPELPSLPTVELPDLPPPPKIPKIFWSVEGMLNIIKLITKAMCFLKQSPFVPEWRAGDQIAFLTERNGYLPTDFIDIQPPAFSYSAISAIKVTTYVNLEFEMEFLLEAVRAITAPIDDMTNNIVNMFDISLSDINLVESVPETINTTIDTDGSIETDLSLAPLDENPESVITLVWLLSAKIVELISYMWENAHETMSSREFISYVNAWISSESFTSNTRTSQIQNLWQEINNLKFTKQQDFITNLWQKNKEKFDTFEEILKSEIEYSKQQQEELSSPQIQDTFIQVASYDEDRFVWYRQSLEKYNVDTLDAAIALASWQSEQSKEFQEEIARQWDDLMERVRWWLDSYREKSLLSAVSWNTPQNNSAWWVCHWNNANEYVYDGIYVLQDTKNYRLFDYIDLLRWDEEITLIDSDNDEDDDVLYLMNNTLYIKENRKNTADVSYITVPPLILSSSDNKFYNWDTYYEAINWFEESSVSDGYMNVIFDSPTDTRIQNFKMVYHTIVDRYLDLGDSYVPSEVETHVVDAFADIDDRNQTTEYDDYSLTPSFATLSYAWATRWVKLTNEKLINLRDDLQNGILVTLTSSKEIYAWDSWFALSYRIWKDIEKSVNVSAYQKLSFSQPVEVLSLTGNAYISLGINEDIRNTDIIDYIGMPLLPGASISFDWNKELLTENDHIDIRYYDGSETFLDFRDVASYTFYDLWESSSEQYTIRQSVENDFYYARILWFNSSVNSTLSQQILLSPQTQADSLAPELALNQKIRIPVYQEQDVDLTPYIYEDSWFSGISDVWVDFDLATDSDWDGDASNDDDSENLFITQTSARISLRFGPFDEIFEKDITISLKDDNDNITTKKVPFEVYPPVPNIIDVVDTNIIWIIDEDLLDEPVRLYRYRWWEIQKLQSEDGLDVIQTDIDWNFDFTTSSNTDWLELTYSWAVVANIDEYTWKIDIRDPFVTTRVLATNNPENTSVYPEIIITRLWQALFKQFLKVPVSRVKQVSSFQDISDAGVYTQLINGEEYGSYSVPLWVSYNPWSFAIYSESDVEKTPVMTIFSDGRININRQEYKLTYQSFGEYTWLVLQRLSDNSDVAHILFRTQASYILK